MNAAFLRVALSAAFSFASSLLLALLPAEPEGGVPEPGDYRTNDYRSPVPKTLAGARVVSVDEVEDLWRKKAAVLHRCLSARAEAAQSARWHRLARSHAPKHRGGHWLPNVGYGVLTPEFESYFKTRLAQLTGNDLAKPVLFYCLRDCWMSWNAAKRALAWGYLRPCCGSRRERTRGKKTGSISCESNPFPKGVDRCIAVRSRADQAFISARIARLMAPKRSSIMVGSSHASGMLCCRSWKMR